ncbi:flagellin [Alteribacter populi]|uniref:flagellin N-terminal helical domain-containing protein n=1 Tax=Alteribacter populi TaxID=2011011 RepID=UPI000BBA8C91|nr:flagellin [Alteribacter populi]
MKINNNIQALNAYRNLHQNQAQTSKNLEKLSSGLRINRAADDAAGLAISEKMRSQIRGLKQAERNAMDGISLMQTAEGALTEVHSMLQRMRELATQGANDTNTPEDREQIQKEMDQLKKEIDSISEKTEFNTRQLLNGSSAVLSNFVDGNNAANMTDVPKVLNADITNGEYRLELDGDLEVHPEITQEGANLTKESIEFADDDELPLGEYTINVRKVTDDSAEIEVFGPDGISREVKNVDVDREADEEEQVNVGGLNINVNDIRNAGTVKVKMEMTAEVAVHKKMEDGSFERITSNKEITTQNGRIRHEGFEFHFNNDFEASGVDDDLTEFVITNNALAFQIGPNTDQNVMIDIPQMDTVELGVEEIDVTTQSGANQAIFDLDKAINYVSDARSKMGAVQNRMEHTINNLQVTHENLTSSESRIRDADMAKEMTEFTRNNILNQSATAMLAQANQLPQGVLQLLQ